MQSSFRILVKAIITKGGLVSSLITTVLFEAAVLIGNVTIADYLYSKRSEDHLIIISDYLMSSVVSRGYLPMAQWLERQGCVVDTKNMSLATYAFAMAKPDLIEWLVQRGISLGDDDMIRAAAAGNIEVMEYLRLHGHPLKEEIYSHSANTGRFDVIVWAHRHKCPCSAKTMRHVIKMLPLYIVKKMWSVLSAT